MSKFILRQTVFQFLLLFAFKTYAQDTALRQLPQQWTLEDCIDYAKKNNIQVRNLQWNEAAGKEDVLQARAAQLPSLSGSISQNAQNGKVITNGGDLNNRATLGGNYSINSSLTVYNGGFLRSDIKSRQLLLESAGLDGQTTYCVQYLDRQHHGSY